MFCSKRTEFAACAISRAEQQTHWYPKVGVNAQISISREACQAKTPKHKRQALEAVVTCENISPESGCGSWGGRESCKSEPVREEIRKVLEDAQCRHDSMPVRRRLATARQGAAAQIVARPETRVWGGPGAGCASLSMHAYLRASDYLIRRRASLKASWVPKSRHVM